MVIFRRCPVDSGAQITDVDIEQRPRLLCKASLLSNSSKVGLEPEMRSISSEGGMLCGNRAVPEQRQANSPTNSSNLAATSNRNNFVRDRDEIYHNNTHPLFKHPYALKSLPDRRTMIGDKIFYFDLANVPGYCRSTVRHGKVTLAADTTGGKGSKAFATFGLFEIYRWKEAFQTQHFYEVIPDDFQKPRFDLDLTAISKENAEMILEEVIIAIGATLGIRGILFNKSRHLLLFTSHGETRKGFKYSYHIILNQLMHYDSREAKAFYWDVKSRIKLPADLSLPSAIEADLGAALDAAVYGISQNFRLLGSGKYDFSSYYRPKIHDDRYHAELYPHVEGTSDLAKQMNLLLNSLISHISECEHIPGYVEEPKRSINTGRPLGDDLYQEISLLLETYNFPKKYENCGEENGYVLLRNKDASSGFNCPICAREHEHENAFVFVHHSQAFFNCRRSKNSFLLGSLKSAVQEAKPTIEISPSPVQGSESKQEHVAAFDTPPPSKKYVSFTLADYLDLARNANVLPEEISIQALNDLYNSYSLRWGLPAAKYFIRGSKNRSISAILVALSHEVVRRQTESGTARFVIFGSPREPAVSSDSSQSILDLAQERMAAAFARAQAAEITVLVEKLIETCPTLRSLTSLIDICAKLGLEAMGRWCVAMKAACGMGKTELFKALLRLAKYTNARVLVVAFRVALTRKQLDDLADFGFVHYQDIDSAGLVDHPRLIVQIDSLYRVRGHYDILVLDEIKYTFGQLIGCAREKHQAEEALRYYVTHASGVYVADALLSNGEIEYLQKCGRNPLVYINLWQKYRGTKVDVVATLAQFAYILAQKVKEGLRILVPTSSAKAAVDLQEMLNRYCKDDEFRDDLPRKRITVYQKGSHPGIDPVPLWIKDDVTIFTPTIVAGNSFTAAHFHEAMCYFPSCSADAEIGVQMIFRSRQLANNRIAICAPQVTKAVFDGGNLEEIKAELADRNRVARREKMVLLSMSKAAACIPADRGTDIYDTEHPYFHMVAVVAHQQNRSRGNFIDTLLGYLKEMGCEPGVWLSAKSAPRAEREDLAEFRTGWRTLRLEMERVEAEAIAAAGPFTVERDWYLQEHPGEATIEDHRSYTKWKLGLRYEAQVTADLARAAVGKNRQHRAATAFSEVLEELERREAQFEQRAERLDEKLVDDEGDLQAWVAKEFGRVGRVRSETCTTPAERVARNARLEDRNAIIHAHNLLLMLKQRRPFDPGATPCGRENPLKKQIRELRALARERGQELEPTAEDEPTIDDGEHVVELDIEGLRAELQKYQSEHKDELWKLFRVGPVATKAQEEEQAQRGRKRKGAESAKGDKGKRKGTAAALNAPDEATENADDEEKPENAEEALKVHAAWRCKTAEEEREKPVPLEEWCNGILRRQQMHVRIGAGTCALAGGWLRQAFGLSGRYVLRPRGLFLTLLPAAVLSYEEDAAQQHGIVFGDAGAPPVSGATEIQ